MRCNSTVVGGQTSPQSSNTLSGDSLGESLNKVVVKQFTLSIRLLLLHLIQQGQLQLLQTVPQLQQALPLKQPLLTITLMTAILATSHLILL